MDDEDVVEELESLSAYDEPFVQQVWTQRYYFESIMGGLGGGLVV